MSEVKYSKYQLAILNEYDTTTNNIVIQAGPGSGKSFTILQLLKRTPKFKKVILTAFNKSIADELKTKVPQNVRVSTIHSLGFSILRSHLPNNYSVKEYKTFITAKKTLDFSRFNSEKEKTVYTAIISSIVDLVRLNLATTKEQIRELCDEYNISVLNGEIDDTISVMNALDEYNSVNHKDFMIDFVDMLWLPYKYVDVNLYPKYDVLFVDESQDLNPLQGYIVDNVVKKTGRSVFVGDLNQAIYSFMGANIKSFQYFIDKPNTTVLPLSVTYRCPKSVAKMASEIFPGIEPFEENQEGIIRYGKLNEVQEGDYLLCRNNLPLVEAWISFVKEGKKCHILGKDFGEQLLSMINKLSKYDSYLEGIEEILRKKINDLIESGVKSPTKHPSYQSLVEKIEIINILKVEFGSFEETRKRVEEIFSNEVGKGIILSTIHKAKGLENDRVFILGYHDLLPSKYAQTELELRQERCLQYVAVTRTKQELVFINL